MNLRKRYNLFESIFSRPQLNIRAVTFVSEHLAHCLECIENICNCYAAGIPEFQTGHIKLKRRAELDQIVLESSSSQMNRP